jgi:hypothetical protein
MIHKNTQSIGEYETVCRREEIFSLFSNGEQVYVKLHAYAKKTMVVRPFRKIYFKYVGDIQ